MGTISGYPRQISDQGHLLHRKVNDQEPAVSSEELEVLSDCRIFPTFKAGGSFDEYRKNASFDWKRLKLILKSPKALKLQVKFASGIVHLSGFNYFLLKSTMFGSSWRQTNYLSTLIRIPLWTKNAT